MEQILRVLFLDVENPNPNSVKALEKSNRQLAEAEVKLEARKKPPGDAGPKVIGEGLVIDEWHQKQLQITLMEVTFCGKPSCVSGVRNIWWAAILFHWQVQAIAVQLMMQGLVAGAQTYASSPCPGWPSTREEQQQLVRELHRNDQFLDCPLKRRDGSVWWYRGDDKNDTLNFNLFVYFSSSTKRYAQ